MPPGAYAFGGFCCLWQDEAMSDQRVWLPIVVVVCACINLSVLTIEVGKFLRWLVSKLRPDTPPASLTLGYCQCGHARCHHRQGSAECSVWLTEYNAGCACQVYIFDPDEDGDDEDETPEPEPDPSVKELERIGRL